MPRIDINAHFNTHDEPQERSITVYNTFTTVTIGDITMFFRDLDHARTVLTDALANIEREDTP